MAFLETARIKSLLRTRTFGKNLVIHPQTGSTNDVVKELAGQGAPEGTVVLTDEQTAGRGRMKRRWLAPAGSCVLCSVLFRPALRRALRSAQAAWLTMICSMAAADAMHKVAGLAVALKWPNDLIVPAAASDGRDQDWRKLAGLLTETGFVGQRLDFVVVGVGINVNVEPDVLPRLAPKATSILVETGRETDRVALVAAMLNGIEARYERLLTGESPHAEWAARLATLGERVQITTAGGTFTGLAEAVDEVGALLLRTSDDELHTFAVGDVTRAHEPEA